MKEIIKLYGRTHGKNAGQAVIEYVIILAVFAVVLLAAIPSFQDEVGTA